MRTCVRACACVRVRARARGRDRGILMSVVGSRRSVCSTHTTPTHTTHDRGILMSVLMCACVCVCERVHTYIRSYMHAFMHTCMNACIHTYIHTYIYICIHVHKYTHILTRTHNACTYTLIFFFQHSLAAAEEVRRWYGAAPEIGI